MVGGDEVVGHNVNQFVLVYSILQSIQNQLPQAQEMARFAQWSSGTKGFEEGSLSGRYQPEVEVLSIFS